MNRKIGKWILIVAIIFIVVVAGLYMAVFLMDKEFSKEQNLWDYDNPVVDMDKYIHIEAIGFDGYGRLKGNIELVQRNDHKTICFKEDAPPINSTGSSVDAATFIYQSLELELSKTENLSNGDVVSYNVKFNNLVDQLVDCQFENCQGTYVVENLPDLTDYNPFDNLNVSIEGCSPYIYIDYRVKDTYISRNSYIPSAESLLSNGDVVTITFKGDEEKLKRQYGKNVTIHKKEYIIDHMPAYVLSADELTDEMMKELCKVSLDVIRNNLSETEGSDDMEYVGSVLYNIKEYTHGKSVINRMNIVHRAKQIINGEEYIYYYPVSFTNLKLCEGVLEYTPSDWVYYITDEAGDKYIGINSIEELYNEMFRLYIDEYYITAYGEMENMYYNEIVM